MLTDIQVRSLKPKEKQYKVTDGDGLYIIVNLTGVKVWRLKYRFQGVEKSLSIGKYPDVSINQARLKKAEAKELLSKNIDPGAAKRESKLQVIDAAAQVVPTFKAVAIEYQDEIGTIRNWGTKHAMKIASTLRMHVFPVIGHLPITDIEPKHVLKCYQSMQSKQFVELPRVALENIEQVFLYANMKAYTKTNPVPAMKMFVVPAEGGHFSAMHYTRLGEFQLRLDTSRSGDLFKLAALFLMHTAVRTGEMRKAQWSEFDLSSKIWTIPSDRMKMKREHKVPLSNEVIELLEQIRALGISETFVFGSHFSRKNPFISENAVSLTIKALGYVDSSGEATHTGHGFRTCFSSATNAHKDLFGANAHESIEFCLAHVKTNQIEAAYNREEYWRCRVKIMTWYSKYLTWLRTQALADPEVIQQVFARAPPRTDQFHNLSIELTPQS